jgi:hypothetical protein
MDTISELGTALKPRPATEAECFTSLRRRFLEARFAC